MYFVIASVSAVLSYRIREIAKVAREEEEKAKTVKLYNTLFNSLSHELRTPIATIIGASDNLLNDKTKISEENKHKLISEISKASFRLNQQVGNLLNMSRLESGSIQLKSDWCDVNELIYSVINQLDEILKHHKVKITIPENFPLVRLDPGLMQQVLYNLINNAAIYTSENSIIKIKAEIHKNTESPNNAFSEKTIIYVEDDGMGFPPEEIEKYLINFTE